MGDLLQQARDGLWLIMPQVMLTLFGIGILITDFFLDARHKWFNALTALVGVAFSGWALWLISLRVYSHANGPQSLTHTSVWDAMLPGFSGTLAADSFFVFFGFLFLGSTALVILLSARYLEIEAEHHGEYYALMLFATVGMMFMVSGTELMTLFVGLETMAISFYVLTGFLRRDRRSNEAALKYLLLGAFSSGLLVYGFSLLYGLTGSTRLPVIHAALINLTAEGPVSNPLLLFAMIVIAAGLFFKVAAVPFHQWAPDVYEGAPTSITAYVSVASKAASFGLLVRIFGSVFDPLRINWELLFTVVAVVTMTVGNFAALTQTNVKRLLAYSSIAHVGYILLGLVPGNVTGLQGIQVYLLAYLFMTTGAFAVVIILRRKGLIGDEIEDMNGLYQRSPFAAVLLLIFMLSLAGIPPTAGFFGKYFIFLGLIQAQRYLLAAVAVLYIVPALYYYFRIVRHAWMADSTDPVRLTISPAQAAVLAVTGFLTLYMGILPQWFIEKASASIFFLGR
jgi:NADH-quinone oxidoreductase subunit N